MCVVALAGASSLIWFTTRPNEEAAANEAADYMRDSQWGLLYDSASNIEKRKLGWSKASFESLMAESSVGHNLDVAKPFFAMSRNAPVMSVFRIAIRNEKKVEMEFDLPVINEDGTYKALIGHLPYYVTAVCSTTKWEHLQRLRTAMEKSGVSELVSVQDMLVLDRATIETLTAKDLEEIPLDRRWRRLPGF